jgi:hypothetical protein
MKPALFALAVVLVGAVGYLAGRSASRYQLAVRPDGIAYRIDTRTGMVEVAAEGKWQAFPK